MRWPLLLLILLLASCGTHNTIVSNVSERDANEIVVYLASKGIEAQKLQATSSQPGAASTVELFNIVVAKGRDVEAMAILARVGLPRKMGTNLLELFGQQGLVSSTFQDNIRYQAGLLEELKNTIRKIDGIIDADIQVSFPSAEVTPGIAQPKVTAAVYIKHQGILEDPNSHLEVKIKRLLAGSIPSLDYDNVAVISDRSRLTDITLGVEGETIGPKMLQTYVSIWGIVMTKSSLGHFRLIFFSLILLLLALCGAIAWLIYKFYPLLRAAKPSEIAGTDTGAPPAEVP
ncbi:MAG: EscJ/YscJ/HrcJ family type III secretion inner membrane ring protein [Chlamydiia bacterium]|nr:EscJ/YscJ/HrcJ family type III secretion inner membrane ring protein [Chlamydiia bacterium]